MEEGIVGHKCTLCQFVSETQEAFSNHFQEQHQSVFFACYLCPRSLNTLDQILLHLNNDHATNHPDRTKIALYDRNKKGRGTVRVGYVEGETLPSKDTTRKMWTNQKCVVEGCESTVATVPAVQLFRFPAVNVRQRYLWVAIVDKRNPDGTAWEAKPWHRICSNHFEGGKPSRVEKDVNFIPTLFKDALEEGPMFRMPEDLPNQVIFFLFFPIIF